MGDYLPPIDLGSGKTAQAWLTNPCNLLAISSLSLKGGFTSVMPVSSYFILLSNAAQHRREGGWLRAPQRLRCLERRHAEVLGMGHLRKHEVLQRRPGIPGPKSQFGMCPRHSRQGLFLGLEISSDSDRRGDEA